MVSFPYYSHTIPMYGGVPENPIDLFHVSTCCFSARPWSSTFGVHKSGVPPPNDRWFHHGAWEVNLIQDEPGCLACFAVFLGHITYNSSKTLENESFKDVFPIEDGDIPLISWFTRGVPPFRLRWKGTLQKQAHALERMPGSPGGFLWILKKLWLTSESWTVLNKLKSKPDDVIAFHQYVFLYFFDWWSFCLVSAMKELLEMSLNTSCFSTYHGDMFSFFLGRGNPFESGISVSSFPGSLLSLSCTTMRVVQWNFPDFCHCNPWCGIVFWLGMCKNQFLVSFWVKPDRFFLTIYIPWVVPPSEDSSHHQDDS